ncbi:polyribonucleotide nucleotidyltransferase [Candidatus Falkowbacteria bacterium RIFOXYA2_FULL_38_12]|uniref:Polyribonucleotide nucleotidyltransferase n=1 Tax=Candidatus Falkowbacteria bacterium RIFOXYA2_FULL_38_12 TaxID=1797993 RepID=A0A1F5S414_9BACT|nr:MAG: polyribonucleotide nucleotidyltransferase [Candidatus Falkowbacteria bacterium RIFOXYA2_FULL_38_12]OGF44545.1 MAG: polyribonucleotide nucleotidyltransferase [Candidatus Falkowbacteria bacterium RIFOXYD2_FULL_39_16]
MIKKFELELGGKKLIVETGKFAGQANGSCTVQYGDTLVLGTVVMSGNIREGIEFFPLMVDYEERLYAAGKIKGSRFIKREGRPSDEAILSGRLVDRAIRPFFDEKIRNDIQVIVSTLSWDQENDSDIPALIAASVALSISDIPWNGPIAGIRIGDINGEFVINPSYEARLKSSLDLVVAGTSEKVCMVEAGAEVVLEERMLEAIKFAQKHLKSIQDLIKNIQKEVGKEKMEIKVDEEKMAEKEELKKKVVEFLKEKLPTDLFDTAKETKLSRKQVLNKIKGDLEEKLKSESVGKDKRKDALGIFYQLAEEEISRITLKNKKRVDSRAFDEIRPLSAEVALLPRTHGTGYFKRGETHVLSAVTLGAPGDEQTLDSMELSGKKRFMHHYNFPPYSVGEAGPLRGPGRREIGHGALAERALMPVLPKTEDFPYTIRVVSEVLSSNGSSSMASTCASSLALMDAGVPLKDAVAGIAMGLVSDNEGNFKVLTDLQDLEDGKGGMDFKIAGTKAGITAMQMDTKTDGLTIEIVKETLEAGRKARIKVLEEMNKAIEAPRPELSQYAPRIISFKIKVDKIREVIGPGGKVINEIIDSTGVSIDIENDGNVTVCSAIPASLDKAVAWIKSLVQEAEVGQIYEGKVVRIMNFGAFVEILPHKDGMVHISELAPYRVKEVTDIVKIGDTVKVKVIEIDEQGRVNLSMKQVKPGEKV